MNAVRRIWLTGASSGIGHELARQLLDEGHRLALSARSSEPLYALARQYPEQVLVLPGDLTDAAQVRAIAAEIDARWGALDSVILNAGTCEYIDVQHFQADLLERVLRANLIAPGYCIEAALPLLRRGERPLLVGVGSSVTWLPLPRAGAYGASKAGLRYLLESLRLDLADYLSEESRTLVGQAEAEARFAELDALKLTLDRLEARVERLALHLKPDQAE